MYSYEHTFCVVKRQFGHTKVRYRGLAKNTAQLHTLFALSNLWMARRQLMALQGQVRPLGAGAAGKCLQQAPTGSEADLGRDFERQNE